MGKPTDRTTAANARRRQHGDVIRRRILAAMLAREREHGPAHSLAELAAAVDVSKSGAAYHGAALVASGLARRWIGGRLTLTDTGRRLARRGNDTTGVAP